MALDTNFNVNPYFDDFNELKKYLRILFKPGYAVQARELTQIQTLLQNQIKRFGNHLFQNGSVVTGGQFFLQNVTFLKLDSTYSSIDVNVVNFEGKTIYSLDNKKRAEVLKVYDANIGTGDPKTLLVKQIYGDTFVSGEAIKTSDNSPFFATISGSGVGTGQVFSVDSGIFYYDGFFIQNDAQTVATSKYSNNTANARIGFEIVESVVSNNQDTSLLDPAQNASNYQAPGSDRYKVSLVLATRSLDSTDDKKFIELSRVENGVSVKENRFPIYSVLEDTLARRTYDESGNYIVKGFNLSTQDNTSNTAKLDLIVSPGKAYVFGYEFERTGPTKISIPKPRTTQNVANKRITADYGNFVYTTNHFSSLPINSLQTVDVHCVNLASINTTSTATISNTKIGTIRVKSIAYESSSNTSNGKTYQYRTFLFDTNIGSITGTVRSATANTIVIGNTIAGQIFTSVSDAYVGSKIRIVSGLGSNESQKVITAFNPTTQTITLNQNFVTTPNSLSVWSIDFEFKDTESLANFSTTTLVGGADISSRSKDPASLFGDVIFSDSTNEVLVFPLGQNYISQNSISDFSFSYKKLYASQSFSSSDSPSLVLGSGESLSSGGSTSSRSENYFVTVTSQGTSPYPVGTIIPSNSFTVDTVTNRINVTSGNNMVANIIATIDVSSISRKNKNFVTANSVIQTTGGVDVFSNSSVVTYGTQGQTHIASGYVNRVPGVSQSLFVSDVLNVTKVLDFKGLNISSANSSLAADITSNFTFDNGQRDSYYDHASIKLKGGSTRPVGPLVVFYNRFTSSGSGFFTVDSYSGVDYNLIPSYSSTKNNQQFRLGDCLDFRPVRSDATTGSGSTVTFNVDPTTTGPKIPENNSDILLDFSYYLPRIDKLVLDKSKKFEVIQGIPSLNPETPSDSETGMTLFVLSYLPYVSNSDGVSVQKIQHKRYTMRDIGSIEKRVENLEYYTSLTLLEQDTFSKQDLTILDSQNLPRFKNGIVVDSFKGHSVADVTNVDYLASIDPVNKELRPAFNITAHRLKFDSANSSNFSRTNNLLTANYTSAVLVDQPKASKAVNVNPFNVINFLGKINLFPPSDIWVDTDRRPEVLVNAGGDRDVWELASSSPTQYEWNSWNTFWTGVPATTSDQWQSWTINSTTTNTTAQRQTRTGISTTAIPDSITTSIGDRIVDVSVIPFMRPINIVFVGNNFRPEREVYPFFDNRPVVNFTALANKFILANNNIGYNLDLNNPEVIQIRNKNTNTSNGTCLAVHSSNNVLYVTNITPNTTFDFANCELVGAQTGLTYNVSSYVHSSGTVYGSTANTLTLRSDASGITGISSANSYVGSDIFINSGVGVGQKRTVTAYNPTTKVITITPDWDLNPVANQSSYTIGSLTTDNTGAIAGLFSVPAGLFRVGEKKFRIMDAEYGDVTSSTTSGDVSFFAQGLLQSKEEVIISTVPPRVERPIANQENYNAPPPEPTYVVPDYSGYEFVGPVLPGPIPADLDSPLVWEPVPPPVLYTQAQINSALQATLVGVSGELPISPGASYADVISAAATYGVNESQVQTAYQWLTQQQVDQCFVGYNDPIAQTFLISPIQYPEGIYLSKIRLCFKSKDPTIPVTLELRPTVNGYPSASVVYPFSTVTLTPDKVKVTNTPNMEDSNTYTEFEFNSPVYMQPGEHSFILIANSNKYEVYAADVGALDIVTNRQISEQPYGGSFFLSQNGATWTPDQNSDMMFRLFRSDFSTGESVAQFLVDYPSQRTRYNSLQLITSDIKLANTSLDYRFNSELDLGGMTGLQPISPLNNTDILDSSGMRVLSNTSNTTFILRSTFKSDSSVISSAIDLTRLGILAIENRINNLELSNSGIVVSNVGSGYANSSDVTVTISGGGGSGATAVANVVSNTINAIFITNGGSGYTTSPTITITAGSGGGSGAVVSYNGESEKSGGNAGVRYITRKVTLADGFDSGDLRVYLTANKPAGTNIYVYYKILSASDSETFDDKRWQLMTELGNQSYISVNSSDYRELIFAPGSGGIADNSVSYNSGSTSYSQFKTFAIKIVMTSSNSVFVPKVKDFRAIALPAG
jgi:hypothetical protein